LQLIKGQAAGVPTAPVEALGGLAPGLLGHNVIVAAVPQALVLVPVIQGVLVPVNGGKEEYLVERDC
jgi:hypothetical protein